MKNKTFFLLMSSLLLVAWNPENVVSQYRDVFSIYLVKNSDSSYASKKPKLGDFVLDSSPLLTVDSISSYTWHSHFVSFSPSVKHGLKQREPLLHFRFVIVANDERIYWGYFTDPTDDYISFSPMIYLLQRNHNRSCIPDGFSIGRAPIIDGDSSEVRSDMRVYNALKTSGKLLP
jgi:hypothetical protein